MANEYYCEFIDKNSGLIVLDGTLPVDEIKMVAEILDAHPIVHIQPKHVAYAKVTPKGNIWIDALKLMLLGSIPWAGIYAAWWAFK